jgi:predicted porin
LKKQILCTSAIALGCAMAAPVSAQEWNLDWGGFMASHVAYVDTSGPTVAGPGSDFDGIGIFTTGEIQFTPSVTLDNGMTFGVNVQLEAQNQSGDLEGREAGADAVDIDESYIEVSSDTFGRILLGNENSAGYRMMTGAPGITSLGINSPSYSAFIPVSSAVSFSFRQSAISVWTEVAGNNDVNRLSYHTPNFNGFSAGVSYARNNNGNADQGFGGPGGGTTNNSGNASVEDIIDFGVNYSGSIGGADITVAGRWGTGDINAQAAVLATVASPGPDGIFGTGDDVAAGDTVFSARSASTAQAYGAGIQVGFGGFTIGGSYSKNQNGSLRGDTEGWTFGATYDAAGPWSFEASTQQGTNKGLGTGASSTVDAYLVGARRDIGPGVSFDVYGIYVEADDNGTVGTDLKGYILGTAINLSF